MSCLRPCGRLLRTTIERLQTEDIEKRRDAAAAKLKNFLRELRYA